MVLNCIKTKIANQELVREKHKIISEAASKLFLKKGFHETTMRNIAQKSGIELSYLYKYISSKDDILLLFYEHIVSQYESIYRAIDASQDEDPLILMKKALLLILETNHRLVREMLTIYTESRYLKHKYLRPILQRESMFVEIFENLIKRGMKKGIFKVKDPFLAANIVQQILIMEVLRDWKLRDRYQFQDYATSTVDFIITGLKVDVKKWQKINKNKKS